MKNIVLLFVFLLSVSFTLKAQNISENFSCKILHREYAEYPGGEEDLRKYIAVNTFYPLSALKDSIEGKVYIHFMIDSAGHVKNETVSKGLHPDCDIMAKSIVRLIPRWTPAYKDGKPIETGYTLPIIFKIPEDKDRIISNDCAMPTFPGGNGALMEFIRKNLKYPVTTSCIQGRVIVRFVINKEGKVSNAFIFRGIDPLLDKEAIKVVNMMPDWIPAHKDGENYNYLYTLPIVFQLN